MADYRRTVQSATRAIDALSAEIEADLDEEDGGIGWWNGHVGWKDSAQLGYYLLASCTGTGDSLRRASLVIEEHRKTEYGLNHARATRMRELSQRPSSRDERIAALAAATDLEAQREELLAVWSEHALVSLAQVLDRLAAVVTIVAGLKEEVIGTDWGKLTKLAEREPRSGPQNDMRQGVFADPGTFGRERQSDLLKIVAAAHEHGPQDWLPWLIKARNTAVHRAPRWNMKMMVGEKRGSLGLITPLSAQPDWAETEAMVAASRGGLESMFLKQTPQAIFDGLLASVVSLTTSLAEECQRLWIARRQDPSLIVQGGATWRAMSKAAVLDFPGYGDAAPVLSNEIALHPSAIRRLRAAKLMGDQVHEWEQDSSSG